MMVILYKAVKYLLCELLDLCCSTIPVQLTGWILHDQYPFIMSVMRCRIGFLAVCALSLWYCKLGCARGLLSKGPCSEQKLIVWGGAGRPQFLVYLTDSIWVPVGMFQVPQQAIRSCMMCLK